MPRHTIRLNFLISGYPPNYPLLDRRCLKCRRKQKSSLGDRCLSCSTRFRPERRRATFSTPSHSPARLPTISEASEEERGERRKTFSGFVAGGMPDMYELGDCDENMEEGGESEEIAVDGEEGIYGGSRDSAEEMSDSDNGEPATPPRVTAFSPRSDNTLAPVCPVRAPPTRGKENVPPGLSRVKINVDDWFRFDGDEVEKADVGVDEDQDWWEGEWRRIVDEEMRGLEEWAMGELGSPGISVGGF